MKRTIIILSAICLASCSAKLYAPSQADVDRGSSKFPGLTADELKHGKALFEQKCTVCHGNKNPTSWTEAQWRKIVPAMSEKGNKSGKTQISPADQDAILKYVITMSSGKK